MTTEDRRDHSIDVFRGICILLVVLGHSIGAPNNSLNKLILSFHMPAFFFISGLLFNPHAITSIRDTAKRKAKGLVWQYLVFSVIGILLYWMLLAHTSKNLGVTFIQSLLGVVWNDNIIGTIVTPGFWFVYDLVWITFISILLRHFNQLAMFVCSIIASFILYQADVMFYFSTETLRILVGFSFFTLGSLVKERLYLVWDNISQDKLKQFAMISLWGGDFVCVL